MHRKDKRGRWFRATRQAPTCPALKFWLSAMRLIWCSRRYQEMLAWWKRSPGLGREIPGATLPICPSVGTPRRLAMAFVLVHIRQVQCMIFMLHGFPWINLVFSEDACTVSTRKTRLSSCGRNSTCLAPWWHLASLKAETHFTSCSSVLKWYVNAVNTTKTGRNCSQICTYRQLRWRCFMSAASLHLLQSWYQLQVTVLHVCSFSKSPTIMISFFITKSSHRRARVGR